MGKRKVTILDSVADAVAEVAFFVEEKGMPETAKIFVAEAFGFFEKLSDERIEHHSCSYPLFLPARVIINSTSFTHECQSIVLQRRCVR
jgi:hypothetical protein